MKATIEGKLISLKDVVVTKNPELDRIFGGRILFPEKNRLAEEQIRKYGLPKELTVRKNID
ncbi:MAG: hypothetical protein H7319_02825 [Spirosoma sp.]|nr:hypothetical protein [Spirosoma sp.]